MNVRVRLFFRRVVGALAASFSITSYVESNDRRIVRPHDWRSPRVHYQAPCVAKDTPTWRDIAAALTVGDTFHVFQGCPEPPWRGWHHASSEDLIHWAPHGIPLSHIHERKTPFGEIDSDDSPCSGFALLEQEHHLSTMEVEERRAYHGDQMKFLHLGGSEAARRRDFLSVCAGFRQCSAASGRNLLKSPPLEIRCGHPAAVSSSRKIIFANANPMYLFPVFANRADLPYDPMRPWYDFDDGRWYATIAADSCNATQADSCASGAALWLYGSSSASSSSSGTSSTVNTNTTKNTEGRVPLLRETKNWEFLGSLFTTNATVISGPGLRGEFTTPDMFRLCSSTTTSASASSGSRKNFDDRGSEILNKTSKTCFDVFTDNHFAWSTMYWIGHLEKKPVGFHYFNNFSSTNTISTPLAEKENDDPHLPHTKIKKEDDLHVVAGSAAEVEERHSGPSTNNSRTAIGYSTFSSKNRRRQLLPAFVPLSEDDERDDFSKFRHKNMFDWGNYAVRPDFRERNLTGGDALVLCNNDYECDPNVAFSMARVIFNASESETTSSIPIVAWVNPGVSGEQNALMSLPRILRITEQGELLQSFPSSMTKLRLLVPPPASRTTTTRISSNIMSTSTRNPYANQISRGLQMEILAKFEIVEAEVGFADRWEDTSILQSSKTESNFSTSPQHKRRMGENNNEFQLGVTVFASADFSVGTRVGVDYRHGIVYADGTKQGKQPIRGGPLLFDDVNKKSRRKTRRVVEMHIVIDHCLVVALVNRRTGITLGVAPSEIGHDHVMPFLKNVGDRRARLVHFESWPLRSPFLRKPEEIIDSMKSKTPGDEDVVIYE